MGNCHFFSTIKSSIPGYSISAVCCGTSTSTITCENRKYHPNKYFAACRCKPHSRATANQKGKKNKKELWWKRRIKRKIGNIRKDISKLEQWKNNRLKKDGEKEKLARVYHVKNEGLRTVIEALKQRVKANAAKIRKYQE